MTLTEIKALLESVPGFQDKIVYWAWPDQQAPPLPWICYYAPSSRNFGADNVVYHPITNINIELYSRLKDPVSEAALESVLTDAGIFYNKTEVYIETEKCFEQIYEIEV